MITYFSNTIKFLLCILLFDITNAGWGTSSEKKVLLKDVNVLTLYHGKMTKGRRSSPVAQLECISGGSAPCSAFQPKVVQCENKGSDGYDVQWECKTDMDNSFRFGNIEVSCEGYDDPDDPYVLHGSCGLRYSIDYTKEGMNEKSQHHNYYGDNNYNSQSYSKNKTTYSSMLADIIVYAVCGVMIYAFYKTCIGSGQRFDERTSTSTTNDDYPSSGSGGGGGSGGYGWFGGRSNNPSAPRYNSYRDDDASCGSRYRGNNATGGAGGFWTGAATGGLLGYMFGNRNNWGGARTGYGAGGYGSGWGSSGYGGGGGWGSGSSFSSSSGTRSASGFGGTSRR